MPSPGGVSAPVTLMPTTTSRSRIFSANRRQASRRRRPLYARNALSTRFGGGHVAAHRARIDRVTAQIGSSCLLFCHSEIRQPEGRPTRAAHPCPGGARIRAADRARSHKTTVCQYQSNYLRFGLGNLIRQGKTWR